MSYADVNGVSIYYEEHGSGEPLILLHGGLGSGDMYAPILPLLAEGRRVITVDLQAHGHTADVDRPLRYETLGDDVAGLIEHLGLAQVDLMGYSFGAATALRAAIQYPHLVRRLVIASIPYRRDGWYPESLASMDQMGSQLAGMLMQSPVYDSYARVAPRVEDFPTGTARCGPWPGWPSCRATRTTTCSPRRICPPRSFPSWTHRRWSRHPRSARDLTGPGPRTAGPGP